MFVSFSLFCFFSFTRSTKTQRNIGLYLHSFLSKYFALHIYRRIYKLKTRTFLKLFYFLLIAQSELLEMHKNMTVSLRIPTNQGKNPYNADIARFLMHYREEYARLKRILIRFHSPNKMAETLFYDTMLLPFFIWFCLNWTAPLCLVIRFDFRFFAPI